MINSKYFKLNEFFVNCHETFTAEGVERVKQGNEKFEISFEDVERLALLATHLDEIRERFGFPIKVNSGFRTKSYNSLVGGVSNSYHQFGRAADLSARGKFSSLYSHILDHCGFTYKPGVVHYESSLYEVHLYPNKQFVHFAYKF